MTQQRELLKKKRTEVTLIKKEIFYRRVSEIDLIWELSFAHSTFDVRNLDRNYRDIVRTARRAHKKQLVT